MKIQLPNENLIWNQPNRGELFGTINGSYNIDLLSEKGKVRISPQIIPAITFDSEVDITTPIAFARSNADGAGSKYYTICGENIYYLKNGFWVLLSIDSPTDSPTLNVYRSDICNRFTVAGGFQLIATLAGGFGVSHFAEGVWTPQWLSIVLFNSPGIPHPLCFGFNNLLLIGNGYQIVSVDDTNSMNQEAVVLPTNYTIDWIKSSGNGYWIGAKNQLSGNAAVFYWDGYSLNYNELYEIPSSYVFSGVIGRDNVPYVINGYGQLLRFNGSAFVEVGRLPIANSKRYSFKGTAGTDEFYPIHRNGMSLGVNDEILILVNAGMDATNTKLLENQLSGIWSYTEENGLVHKYAITKNSGSNEYDYGSPELYAVGALHSLPKSDGSFYAGTTLYSTADEETDKISMISSLDTSDTTKEKMGYLITPSFYTTEIEEVWQDITALYQKLTTTGNKIIVKYRFDKKYEDIAAQAVKTGTWVTTTTFTMTDIGDLVVGDEIEILSGRGSGLSATITDITETTITIDTETPSASGVFTFRAEAWIKLHSITDIVSTSKKISVGKSAPKIQFKIILFGKGDNPELERLLIHTQTHLK